MGERLKVPEKTIKLYLDAELRDARDRSSKDRERRSKALKAYFQMPLGNERPNRNNIVASNVYSQVEGIMPHLVRQFLSSDDKIEIVGDDEEIASGLKVLCRDTITDQGGFIFIYTLLKDGVQGDNGTCKSWWRNQWDKPVSKYQSGMTREAVDKLRQSAEWTFEDDLAQDGYAEVPTGALDPYTLQPEMVAEPTFSGTATYRKLLESGPVLENLPPDEFIYSQKKKRMNDRHFCGHRKPDMTVGDLKRLNEELSDPSGEPFFHNLRQVAEQKGEEMTEEDNERQEREEITSADYTFGSNDLEQEYLGRKVEYLELYLWIPVNGRMERVIVWKGNGVTMRVEKNEDGVVPFSSWSAVLITHRLIGLGLGAAAVTTQNMTTMLARGMLDSVAFSLDKAVYVQDPSADLLGFQGLYPGKQVNVNPNMVKEMDHKPIPADTFRALEWLKAEDEEALPSTRLNQGILPNSNNKTARGIDLLQKAAFSKTDLVNMIFAELCLSDIYQKLITLFQKNMIKPVPVMVDGKKIVLTREMIQGDYRARASLGIEVDFNEREFQKTRALMGDVREAYSIFPHVAAIIYPIEKIYNIHRRNIVAAGYKDPTKFIESPEQWEAMQQGQPPGAPVPTDNEPSGNLSFGGMSAAPDEGMAMAG